MPWTKSYWYCLRNMTNWYAQKLSDLDIQIKIMAKKTHNRHHLIWKCNKKRANVDKENNIITIEKVRHDWLNSLFQCLQSPHEQLWYLREMYDSILSDCAKELFDALLSLKEWEFYEEDLVKKWALKSKK